MSISTKVRTYKRKKPQNEEIQDVHKLCRLCLCKTDSAVPIFYEGTDNAVVTLALRITICTGLEISRDDSLPNIICKECNNQLQRHYTFRKRCEASYQKLKSHLLAVKMKPNIESTDKDKNIKNDNEKFIVELNSEGNMINLSEDSTVQGNNKETSEHIDNTTPQNTDPDLDISTFLSAMLLQLGVVSQRDGIVHLESNANSFELETGDGEQVVLELVEEEMEQAPNTETIIINKTLSKPVEPKIAPKIDEQNIKKELNNEGEIFMNTYKEPEKKKKHTKGAITTTSNATTPTTNKSAFGVWCSECGRRLASRSALARHKRVHSGEKPHSCQDCGRNFAQKEVMLRHRLVHAEDRPFKCTECPKSFTQRGALRSHLQSHTLNGTRALMLHRCHHCPKLFLYASGLSRHLLSHSGRVYVCGACERPFSDKSSLMRHLKNAQHTPAQKQRLEQLTNEENEEQTIDKD